MRDESWASQSKRLDPSLIPLESSALASVECDRRTVDADAVTAIVGCIDPEIVKNRVAVVVVGVGERNSSDCASMSVEESEEQR